MRVFSVRLLGRVIVALILAAAMIAVCSQHVAAQVAGLTGTLAVTNKSASTATIIDVATGRALATLPTGLTPDGAEVWVGSNNTGRVSVVDPRTGTVTTAAEGFGWPYRILFTPDARTVLLPDLRRDELRIVERAGHRELARLTFPGGGPQGITTTPDGRYAFQSLSRQGRVTIIDLRTRAVVGHLPGGPSPDGVVYTTLTSG
ncbi:MAG: YncE family protein [Gemmatimonadaceae bacterium]